MGSKKTTTTQQSANTYGQYTPTDTADISAFRAWNPQIDPGLASQYGNAKNQFKQSFINPLGGYASPQVRDAQMRTGMRNLNQDEAQAFRSGYYDVNALKGAQLGSLAGLTAPKVVSTGGSSSGTVTQPSDLLGNILGGAATVGSAAIT